MTSDTSSLFCPLEFRYGRPEVREVFSRTARLERALRVEAALAAAEAEVGVIASEDARAIERAATVASVPLDRVDELERSTRHDVMALTLALAEAAGPAGRWVHFGATSADVTDTALALEHRECVRILREDLTRLARVLVELGTRHRATPEIARTHGQHGIPFTFGYKVAVAAAEVLRHRRRLDELAPRFLVGKIAGAVGTGAGFGDKGAAIEAAALRRLGLGTEEAPTQIVGRDRIAEFTNLLALVAGTAERLATEVRNLQRTEIGEAREAFDEERQVGSSTMAQKRNPMLSENVTSLARLVRSLALAPLENMVQWHERDLANSANERIVLPHAVLLLDDILTKLADVFGHLEVDVDRMAQAIAASRGGVMTESLMLALTAKGLPRSEAHDILRRLTRNADSGPSLEERAKADPAVLRHLSPEEVARALDPAEYVRVAAAKTDRVLGALASELGR